MARTEPEFTPVTISESMLFELIRKEAVGVQELLIPYNAAPFVPLVDNRRALPDTVTLPGEDEESEIP